jgi:hypothetical protein
MKCSDHHQPTTALATFPGFFYIQERGKDHRRMGSKKKSREKGAGKE